MRRLLLSLALLLAAGCTTWPGNRPPVAYQADTRLVVTSHAAIEELLKTIPSGKSLDRSQPIIVASLVNIDDLTSSRLGRILSEQLGTGLTGSGYAVVELKLRGTIFIKQGEGELLLSRELKEITRKHQAQAVLVGTYAQSLKNLFISLKLVGVGDNQVIAAHDFVLPIDSDVRSLLWTRGS